MRAVDGIDLQVAPGEIYGFLGPNGAGKSTTVLVLTTLLPPTAGTARVAGLDVVHQGAEVRRAIGASLQESALDPFLTGREHMRLQSALHGLGRAERERRGSELLERVGLTDAADRKVGGYSGGMKRRLDLGLALVHGPRLLFLDEPTTGLDPQSRAALWDEVRRLADDGVTVFLTTQYLEEADVLADRVGIIDRGKIVAEGTPAELKAAIGRPSVEAIPAGPRRHASAWPACCSRFGEQAAASPDGVAVRLPEGVGDLAEIVRALDAEGVRDRRPAAARAHARRRVPRQDGPLARGRRRRASAERGRRGADGDAAAAAARMSAALSTQVGVLARRSMLKTLRQPFQLFPIIFFPLILLAVNASGLKRRHAPAGLPDRLLRLLRDRRGVHPGRHVLADQHRHQPRRGHRERLLQPARADAAAPRVADRRAARRRGRARRRCSRPSTS